MRALALLALSLVLVGPAAAQPFPAKPLRLFVGFSPGGGVDITGRIVAAKLSELWGQAITVENRLGAGGTLAADAVVEGPARQKIKRCRPLSKDWTITKFPMENRTGMSRPADPGSRSRSKRCPCDTSRGCTSPPTTAAT